MRNDFYPVGTVNALLTTDLVTPVTKEVLNQRLNAEDSGLPRFLNEKHFQTLQSVCGRLIPQTREHPVDLPKLLDTNLHSGSGNGWRYASLPDDNTAMVTGLAGIEEESYLTLNSSFHLLIPSQQDKLLNSVQQGTTAAPTWQAFSGPLFFEELLAQLVEIYYSHPAAKDEIGDASFADAKGWANTGLQELELYEPRPLKKHS
jgi:gluconate 2-dehydrogenase gamma chain